MAPGNATGGREEHQRPRQSADALIHHHGEVIKTDDTQGRRVGWFKVMRTDEAQELISANPLAYSLAALIAHRSKWREGFNANGLQIGEALIGDLNKMGMSRMQYRTAKQHLEKWGFATFRTTNKGTVARLTCDCLFSVIPTESQDFATSQNSTSRATSRATISQPSATPAPADTYKAGNELPNQQDNRQGNHQPTISQPLTKNIRTEYPLRTKERVEGSMRGDSGIVPSAPRHSDGVNRQGAPCQAVRPFCGRAERPKGGGVLLPYTGQDLSEIESLFQRHGLPQKEAKRFFDHYESTRWLTNTRRPVTDLLRAIRAWKAGINRARQ